MKVLSQALLNEQIQLNRTPAVKLQIQAYDFPDESSTILFNKYDWVVTGAKSGDAWATYNASDVFTYTSSDIVLTAYISVINQWPNFPDNKCNLILEATVKRGGSWSGTISKTIPMDYEKFSLCHYGQYYDWNGNLQGGDIYETVVLENVDADYADGDWFIIYTVSQTKPGGVHIDLPTTKGTIIYGLYSIILGNGTYVSPNSWGYNAEVTLTDTKANIVSLSQLSHFSPRPLTIGELAYEQVTMPILLARPELLETATIHPRAFVYKVSGYPLLLSLWNDGRVYICELATGTNITTATFDKAYTFYCSEPLKLGSDATYLYAYNHDDTLIYRTPLPSSWSVPTIGTGAGSSLEILKAKILSIKENVPEGGLSTSTLDITFNNSDDYFDSPGAGDLAVLAIGSRINLYLGYTIATVDTFQEYARYFVDSWGYTRAPNLSEFTIHCVDAWGLLEKYRFNRGISILGSYSVYQWIEYLCLAIGGSLSYINRSSYITTFCPIMEVNAGETAANLLRRLLALVRDEIRFFGNDGYIVYPQTGDKETYLYKFPVT